MFECNGTFQTTRLLEQEGLEQDGLFFAQDPQLEVGRDLLLVLGDCLLALQVGGDQARGEIQLDGGEGHQLVEHLEGPLARKAVEQANEAELVGEPEAVPGAPPPA